MISLKQFVPQKVCLSCDGCCRFKEAESVWQPLVLTEDREALSTSGLADRILGAITPEDRRIRTHACGGQHQCLFFNPSDNTCGIYPARPLECRLYPFILSRHDGKLSMYVHLSCPHIQDTLSTEMFKEYIQYLQEYVQGKEAQAFFRRNAESWTDYSEYASELMWVFDVTDKSHDTGHM